MLMQKKRLSHSQVAILWDWQNVRPFSETTPSTVKAFASLFGEIVVLNVYSDWHLDKSKRHIDWVRELDQQGFDAIAVSCGPNSADKKLIDGCKRSVLHNPTIQTVILLSADGDFKNLVRDLKTHGKKVIVIARNRALIHKSLQKLADCCSLTDIEQRFNDALVDLDAA
jgi:uncharacterized protein (TIGR00288 family)